MTQPMTVPSNLFNPQKRDVLIAHTFSTSEISCFLSPGWSVMRTGDPFCNVYDVRRSRFPIEMRSILSKLV